MNRTKRVNISIDIDLFNEVRPYINNLSGFINKCLANYAKKLNLNISKSQNYTSRLLLEEEFIENDYMNMPNITYIMNNAPVQMSLFDIVDNVVLFKDEHIITYPTNKINLINNCTLFYNNKKYFYKITNLSSPDLKHLELMNDIYYQDLSRFKIKKELSFKDNPIE